MAFHPLGTARMAGRPTDGVTAPDHRVHGTTNLHVSDGSAVPTALGVNPQLTIMAFATRLASQLLA
jgi:choline dehydrogenase-like flavoprotein